MYDSIRSRRIEHRTERGGHRSRLAKVGGRIEFGRHQHEYALASLERSEERRVVIKVSTPEFAASLCPSLAFSGVSHHGSNSLACGQKIARHLATDIACDSCNRKHYFAFP
jgi:hypothetical protein